uniref:BZIP domain-containing protein n=1 Tax=Peronospora matthiolae TaxID=2874970 RepID=A0AAV1U3P4_9STRA
MQQQQQPSDVDDGRGDSDLPSSLPSYTPASSSQSISGASLYSYKRLNQSLAEPDADASPRQWNSRPGIHRRSTSARSTDTAAWNDPHLSRLQPSPSEGMRSMTFRDGAGFQMQTEQDQAMRPLATTGTSMTVAGRQAAASVAQISAAQFAASTGGLSMDTALLARVSGTDPSLMGSEDIKQIMRTPDLLSIYQKLQEEDDRRQRRLERNRASARVRREKKKGMVETYEGEVSKLETALNILKKHEFGTGDAHELATALEYGSGEHLRNALLSKDAKMELMARILGQHSKNTDAIRRANAENQALIAVASNRSELFLSLRTQLGLTDTQCQRIASLAIPAGEEARKLDAILKCFSALQAHDWLYVPGIETILHQSRNTMTPHQFQKFLSWTLENQPSIDQLQFLPTASASDSEKDLAFTFSED